MASSCTFIINGNEKITDHVCFRRLINSGGDNEVIIIEKGKLFYPINEIRSYLNDLKEMGFNFTYRYDRKSGNFAITINSDMTRKVRTLFCMVLRFLWEGKYTEPPFGSDRFYKVFDHYINIKEIYPGMNKFALLCYACNAFLSEMLNYNGNHFLSTMRGCKILSHISEMEPLGTINNQFTVSYYHALRKWDKVDYKELINSIDEERKLI